MKIGQYCQRQRCRHADLKQFWQAFASRGFVSDSWAFLSYFISANLFALLFHFLLINDVRMTTFTHQLLSRKKINARSLIMRVRTFQPQCCGVCRRVAHGLCRRLFHSTMAESYTPCDEVLGKKLPDIKVRCGRYKWSLQQDGVPSHAARNIETCSVRTCRSLSQHFLYRIARIRTRLPCHLG